LRRPGDDLSVEVGELNRLTQCVCANGNDVHDPRRSRYSYRSGPRPPHAPDTSSRKSVRYASRCGWIEGAPMCMIQPLDGHDHPRAVSSSCPSDTEPMPQKIPGCGAEPREPGIGNKNLPSPPFRAASVVLSLGAFGGGMRLLWPFASGAWAGTT
jgi:hypothetical protein